MTMLVPTYLLTPDSGVSSRNRSDVRTHRVRKKASIFKLKDPNTTIIIWLLTTYNCLSASATSNIPGEYIELALSTLYCTSSTAEAQTNTAPKIPPKTRKCKCRSSKVLIVRCGAQNSKFRKRGALLHITHSNRRVWTTKQSFQASEVEAFHSTPPERRS